MRRKNIILSTLLIVALLLIWLTRFAIKKDSVETEKAQLEYFSDHLKLQKDFILASYQQSAVIITEHLYRSVEIQHITRNVGDATSEDAIQMQAQLNNYTHPIFQKMKQMGVSYINFSISYPFIYVPQDSIALLVQKPEVSFALFDSLAGFKFSFPFFIKNHQIGNISVAFDYRLIKKQLASIDIQSQVGYLLFAKNTELQSRLLSNNIFNAIPELEGILLDKEFPLPEELKANKEYTTELINEIKNRNKEEIAMSEYSKFFNLKEAPLAIALTSLPVSSDQYDAYLVSIYQNQLLDKVNELNRAVYIINVIIIILGIFGIAYLINNQAKILRQKQHIQNSEARFKEMNKSKDKFFSIIAHDLKNPFNGIMGMSGYLSLEFEHIDNEEKKEIINDINISSKNAYNLLQNLLEWTRAQSGVIKNSPIEIIPKQIIDLSLETVTNLAKHKDITITQEINTDKTGFADENLVSTVIRNLCTNAIKFSPRNSEVTILVKEYQNELVFCVQDKGTGLKSEEIDQLFRIDVNFHKRGTEQETGTGLGLKLCKEFVQYCKGRIWVVSDYGNGSSFYFTIPIYNSKKQ